ncbi:MAG: methionine--tRNA ligase [Candidatus Paceibacterota bacterium]
MQFSVLFQPNNNMKGDKPMNKKILVAAAWPYANGSLHLGRVAGILSADIIARYARSAGNEVLFVSGSDCHGTPIAVEADKLGVHPREIAEKFHQEFQHDLIENLKFSYDCYTTTTTENHQRVVQEVFLKLYNDGVIYTKTEDLPYCASCKRFLPDRYVEGECPICHFDPARGDQCDECGNLLNPDQLLKPQCKLCGKSPEWRPSEHFYLRLSAFTERLREWAKDSEGWRANSKQFTLGLLKEGLPDRAITRDTNWGVPIPLPGYETKRIYVWFEAVCGYLSASKEWAQKQGQENLWEKFWLNESAVHYYVHGKDNIPFHTVVWPSILLGFGGLHLPDHIISSEYLTLKKCQFSKSRNWEILLNDFVQKFDPETLRYYLIANGPETADADFAWENYRTRTNTELIGVFGNYIHRVLSFVKAHFPEGVSFPDTLNESQAEVLKTVRESFAEVAKAIEEGRLRNGLRVVFDLAAHGNRYINNAAPWFSIKEDRAKAEADLAVGAHLVHCLAILVSPFLPTTAEKINRSVGAKKSAVAWQYPEPSRVVVEHLEPLYKRIEEQDIAQQNSLLKGS